MKFGPASPADAVGGVTVHTLRQGSLVLKKGTTIGPAEVTSRTRTMPGIGRSCGAGAAFDARNSARTARTSPRMAIRPGVSA